MTGALSADALSQRLDAALTERSEANAAFFDAEAERLASLCHRMAERFARSGRLVAFGSTPAARSDVRHIAVEFVHPVIVGKRALPSKAPCASARLRSSSASRSTRMGSRISRWRLPSLSGLICARGWRG